MCVCVCVCVCARNAGMMRECMRVVCASAGLIQPLFGVVLVYVCARAGESVNDNEHHPVLPLLGRIIIHKAENVTVLLCVI